MYLSTSKQGEAPLSLSEIPYMLALGMLVIFATRPTSRVSSPKVRSLANIVALDLFAYIGVLSSVYWRPLYSVIRKLRATVPAYP